MIAWLLFFSIVGASIICTLRLVPRTHVRNYACCRKDRTYWLATGLFNAIWIVAAVQSAVAVSVPPPLLLSLAGAAMMVVGHALVIWARRVNPYALPVVAVPERMITTGPYAVCDHPMYTGLALTACGSFFLLGQSWAFFPAFAYLCLIARRITVEERFLSIHFQ